jgi:hypothetical protein
LYVSSIASSIRSYVSLRVFGSCVRAKSIVDFFFDRLSASSWQKTHLNLYYLVSMI